MDTRRPTLRSRAATLLLAVSWLIVSCDGATPPPVFPDLVVTTQTLPPATEGEPYQANVHAQGGDGAYQWAVTSGALPPGLGLTTGVEGEAVISGEPTAPGDFGFTVTVVSGDGQSAARAFTLSVGFADLAIVTEGLPPATQRVAYLATVQAEGGDGAYQWTVASGALPPGVTLATGDEGEAVISGVPQADGEFAFTLRVQSGDGQTASRTFSVNVAPGLDELVIVTQALPAAALGEQYLATVHAEGGDGAYEWTIASGALPSGLALTTGEEGEAVISGVPEATGEFEFTLGVESGDGQTASRTFVIAVGEGFPDLVIVTDALPSGALGDTYSEAVHAAGGDGAYAWEVTSGSLPPGLALSVDDLGEGEHAIISGVPDEDGDFVFTLTVTSGDGQSASRQFTVTILPAAPVVVETPAVPPALAGASYNVALKASGGDGQTFEWTVVEGVLPAGLGLTAAGRIQGTPAAADTAAFTVEVRSAGQSQRRSYELAVVPNRPDEYNITIFPVTPIPAAIQPHFDTAVAHWEQVITGNLQAVALNTARFDASGCGGFIRLVDGTATDDLLIIVSIEPIDGPGGVLGRAGPCLVRTDAAGNPTGLPPLGVVILDVDDVTPRAGDQELTHIISHEIGHVLGFGTIWNFGGRALRTGTGTDDPRFVGQHAVHEWQALGGQGNVPVEETGGDGTRDSHWRQSVFGTERMTGFSAGRNIFQPLSRVSVGSMRDLGYTVDMARADAFTLPSALFWPDDLAHLREILIEPVGVVYPDGRTRPIQPH